jgi:hypothetical protein
MMITMKTIINKIPTLFLTVFALWACSQKELEYNAGSIDAVDELIAPTGEETTYLDDSDKSVMFEWSTVSSGAVKYEIAFSATASGEEIYRFSPADGGANGTAAISLTVLDRIASLAGIKTASEGDIYWTVYTTKGPLSAKSGATPKKLHLSRLTGIDSPTNLYITGEASEGGTDITAAQQFRQDIPGKFEIYTKLKADQPFVFANNNAGTGYVSYAWSNDERIFVEEGEPMTVVADGIYHVTADIAGNRYTIELIENLRLTYPTGMEVEGTPTYDFPMEYRGGGVWVLEDLRFEFTDNRYAFHLDVAGKPRIWGYNEKETNSVPSTTGGTYYNIFQNAGASEFDYCYRLMSGLVGVTTDVYVDMSAAAPAPTHRFDLPKVDEVPSVSGFNAPAADATIDLNTDFSIEFSWEAIDVGADGFPPKYEVVFFADAGGETELAAVQTDNFGMDALVTIGRSTLDDAVRDTDVAVGETGTIYWSVRTIMLDDTAPATPAPRALEVTRIALPDNLYISGAATEELNVADALKMPKVEDGVFEGYYSFTNNTGGFRLTDGTTGEYITYSFSDEDGFLPATDNTATISTSDFAEINSRERQYRIRVDMKANTITTQIIRTVRIHIQGRGTNNTMTYQGNGVWSRANWSVGTGNDTRYYFRVSYTTTNPSSNGNAWTEKWGCSKSNSDPNPTADNLEATYGGKAYYDVVTLIGQDNFRLPGSDPNENDWHYAWKMVTGGSFTNTGNKTFTLYMNGGTGTGATTGEITSDKPFHTY